MKLFWSRYASTVVEKASVSCLCKLFMDQEENSDLSGRSMQVDATKFRKTCQWNYRLDSVTLDTIHTITAFDWDYPGNQAIQVYKITPATAVNLLLHS